MTFDVLQKDIVSPREIAPNRTKKENNISGESPISMIRKRKREASVEFNQFSRIDGTPEGESQTSTSFGNIQGIYCCGKLRTNLTK